MRAWEFMVRQGDNGTDGSLDTGRSPESGGAHWRPARHGRGKGPRSPTDRAPTGCGNEADGTQHQP